MTMNRRRPRCAAAAGLILLASACGGREPYAPPPTGSVQVNVTTLGGDPDADGYVVVLDQARRYTTGAATTVRLPNLLEGVHTVTLDDVAPNCAVASPSSQTVTVVSAQTVGVSFQIECVATAVNVTTRTSGTMFPATYQLLIDGTPSILLAPIGSAIVSRLQPGTRTFGLAISAEHCRVLGQPSVSVVVAPERTQQIDFEVECVPPIRKERIAFVFDTTYVAGLTWVAVVNADGSGIRQLGAGSGPAWSPDGALVAYSDANCEAFFYYKLPCTGGVSWIDPETTIATAREETRGGFEPAWAPAGQEIAFTRCCTSVLARDQLWVLSTATGALTQLYTPGATFVDNPAWSPDGQRIAFECASAPALVDLCVIDRNSGGVERLATPLAVPNRDPAWSPDGTRIAFTSDGSIVVMRLADRTVTKLTAGFDPAWSPDGTRLVFAGADGLHVIDADGSNLTRLTTGSHRAPTWRP